MRSKRRMKKKREDGDRKRNSTKGKRGGKGGGKERASETEKEGPEAAAASPVCLAVCLAVAPSSSCPLVLLPVWASCGLAVQRFFFLCVCVCVCVYCMHRERDGHAWRWPAAAHNASTRSTRKARLWQQPNSPSRAWTGRQTRKGAGQDAARQDAGKRRSVVTKWEGAAGCRKEQTTRTPFALAGSQSVETANYPTGGKNDCV